MRRIHLLTLFCLLVGAQGFSQNRTLGLFTYEPGAMDGYVLFCPGTDSTQYLIDNCGDIVHTWESEESKPQYSIYLLEDGRLLRVMKNNKIEWVNWDGTIDNSYKYDGPGYLHHDIEVLPNGNVLAIVGYYRPMAECIAAGRDPNMMQNNYLVEESIIEVKPNYTTGGEIVWRWSVWDHLVQDFDNTKDNYGVVEDHPELIDLNYFGFADVSDFWHMNAVDYNADLDQIAISTRFYDELYIIDHSTTMAEAAGHSGGQYGKGGDILYRWGNPEAYGAGGPEDKVLFGPHDPNWIEDGLPDAGKMMIFNNGWRRDTPYAEVLIIEPPADQNGNYPALNPGTAYGPATPYWSFTTPNKLDFTSEFVSGARRLPNGNTLVCAGAQGRIFEIDENKNIVWDYVNPHFTDGPHYQGTPLDGSNNFVFRAYRYAIDYPPFLGKTLPPQGKIELNPIADNCTVDYQPPDSVIQQPVGLYPNPAIETVEINLEEAPGFVEVRDARGQHVWSGTISGYPLRLIVARWEPGLYVFRTENGTAIPFLVIRE